MALDEPLSEAELDVLETFLLSDTTGEMALDLCGAHGLFTALHIGPELVLPREWLPILLGGAIPGDESFVEVLPLLMRLYNEAGRAAATRDFEPLHYVSRLKSGIEVPIVEEWCVGFLAGVALRRRAWKRAETDLAPALAPIRAFGEINAKDPGAPPFPQTVTEHLELVRAIPISVRRIRRYFRASESGASHQPTKRGRQKRIRRHKSP